MNTRTDEESIGIKKSFNLRSPRVEDFLRVFFFQSHIEPPKFAPWGMPVACWMIHACWTTFALIRPVSGRKKRQINTKKTKRKKKCRSVTCAFVCACLMMQWFSSFWPYLIVQFCLIPHIMPFSLGRLHHHSWLLQFLDLYVNDGRS